MQNGKNILQVKARAKRDGKFYEKLGLIARNHAIPAKRLERFMIGKGTLRVEELERLLDDFEAWILVVYSQNVAANTTVH